MQGQEVLPRGDVCYPSDEPPPPPSHTTFLFLRISMTVSLKLQVEGSPIKNDVLPMKYSTLIYQTRLKP